jgi:hypothetical protein
VLKTIVGGVCDLPEGLNLKFLKWEIGKFLPNKRVTNGSVLYLIRRKDEVSTLNKFPNFPFSKFQN